PQADSLTLGRLGSAAPSAFATLGCINAWIPDVGCAMGARDFPSHIAYAIARTSRNQTRM
ncbi:MAG: hypothetical protein ABUK14_04155, partial [Desulfobacteria bacterium]